MGWLFAWVAKRWITKRLGLIWEFVRANPWRAGFLLVLCALIYERWQHVSWRDFGQNVIEAGKQNETAQAKVIRQPAIKSASIAKASNDETPAYLEDLQRRAARHVVRVQDPRGQISSADLPGTSEAVEGVLRANDQPGASGPELVCLPEIENRWLVQAAGKAAEMHQQALDGRELGYLKAEE